MVIVFGCFLVVDVVIFVWYGVWLDEVDCDGDVLVESMNCIDGE